MKAFASIKIDVSEIRVIVCENIEHFFELDKGDNAGTGISSFSHKVLNLN